MGEIILFPYLSFLLSESGYFFIIFHFGMFFIANPDPFGITN